MPKPQGFKPPYIAFEARFPGAPRLSDIVFVQIGVQDRGEGTAGDVAALRRLLSAADGLQRAERGWFQDRSGRHNDLFFCYWTDRAVFDRWRRGFAFEAWLADAAGAGRWIEVAEIPLRYAETLYSHDRDNNGYANAGVYEVTETHAYWGAARDRIPAAAIEELARAEPAGLAPRVMADGDRRRRIEMAANACIIRTAQDWVDTKGEERTAYLDNVMPVLRRGAEYLRDHGGETRCFDSRFVHETTMEGAPTDRSCVVALFHSLADLEEWTWNHATHKAIYETFIRMMASKFERMDLKLWHEVSVLPLGRCWAEYVNCAPDTGFLATAGE